MSGCLRVLSLLVLAFPTLCYAQSLGDVARQSRAEKQSTGTTQTRVITNDDLVSSPAPQPADAKEAKSGREQNAAKTTSESSKPTKGNDVQPAPVSADELERQRRTDEMNQHYLERIATLRSQLDTAQLELGKLQGSYEHPWELDRYDAADFDFHYQQMLNFNQHLSELIESQEKLMASLKSQLESLKEEARHAGVPHVED